MRTRTGSTRGRLGVADLRTFESLRRLGWNGSYIAVAHLNAEDELARVRDGNLYAIGTNTLFVDSVPMHAEIRAVTSRANLQYPVTQLSEGFIAGLVIEAVLDKTPWPATPQKVLASMNNLKVDLKGLRGGPLKVDQGQPLPHQAVLPRLALGPGRQPRGARAGLAGDRGQTVSLGANTAPGLLAARARSAPDSVAFRSKHLGLYRERTWRDYASLVGRCARGLRKLGLAPGERVAIMGDACEEWVICDLAAQAAGAISYGVYPTASASELEYQMRDGGATIFVAEDQEYVDRLLPLLDRLPAVKAVVVIDDSAMFAYQHQHWRRTAGCSAAPMTTGWRCSRSWRRGSIRRHRRSSSTPRAPPATRRGRWSRTAGTWRRRTT